MSGPAKRGGSGQIELMRTLWNRVRDGFRRYMKRGKIKKLNIYIILRLKRCLKK